MGKESSTGAMLSVPRYVLVYYGIYIFSYVSLESVLQ